MLPSGIRQQAMERYLKSLLRLSRDQGAALPEWIENFSLVSIADDNAVQALFDQGVKSISLDIGQYLETAQNREEGRSNRSIIQNLGLDVIMDLVKRDEDRQQIEEAENVNARLVVWISRNRRGIGIEQFTEIARDVTDESPDDITFVTTTGQEFKRGDLITKREIQLPSDGQTVSYRQAWEDMGYYFDELQQSGLLDL